MKQTDEQTYKEVKEKSSWIAFTDDYEEFIDEMKKASPWLVYGNKAYFERNKQHKELNNGKEEN